MADAKTALSKIRHDLRTPLNQIIGYTEMIQEEAGEDLQPDLAKVHSAAKDLVKGIDVALERVVELLGMPPPESGPSPTSVPGFEMSVAPLPPGERGTNSLPIAASNAKLLVVDDVELNRSLLQRRLGQRGFSVETAESGEQALTMIAETDYDLVVLDVMMPGLSGIDVLKRVRETKSASDLPIIMATARDGSSDVVEALECGANDYVTKPIDMAVLLARANSQLALKEATARVRKLAGELEARNKFIRDAFGRYLTDEVVQSLLDAPEGLALGGESRTVTLMMSDLRGFSSLSEGLAPSQVVTLLNSYLGAMTDIIVKHGGTIDEFIGDAILVIFGAPMKHPDHAKRAVACALEMQLAMASVNDFNRTAGLPLIEMGIGINTGEVVVGNIGSHRRAKYGVVGGHVNMASRIEALTIGGQILVAEATLGALGEEGLRIDGHVDFFPKGAREAMRVYDIGGAFGHALVRDVEELSDYDEALHVEFGILDGVHAPKLLDPATIVASSKSQAVLATDREIPLLKTVKVRIAGVDTYAKATSKDHTGYVIRFTSLPESVAETLRAQAVGRRSRV